MTERLKCQIVWFLLQPFLMAVDDCLFIVSSCGLFLQQILLVSLCISKFPLLTESPVTLLGPTLRASF